MKQITEQSFFGIPWILCTIFSSAIAIIYLVVWPNDTDASGIPLFILQYAHSLVWILLAVASFIMFLKVKQSKKIATYLAKASLGVYVVFMVTFLIYKVL